MFTINGYTTREQLHDGAASLILRATRETDGLPVILKVLRDPRPSPERIARFKREYHIVEGLALEGAVKAVELLHASDRWVLVQEDGGGTSLAKLGIAGRADVGELLSIAATLAAHLAALHAQSILHKDINPSNIVLNRRSGAAQFIDFGISARLAREPVAFEHPSLVEGTLAYLAPEQTGRMNRSIDQRADLYALGATLYELFSGKPPFESEDPLELIHAHLARVPDPITRHRPDLPPVLGSIIARLLAKSPADRYQSARGLCEDLIRCQDAWSAKGEIPSFPLGAKDVADRLLAPSRLYGRDAQISDLVASFDEIAGGGTALVLVSGPSGIGKSALVKELYPSVTARRGSFASGKFDQLRRDRPYGPFLDAIDALIGHALMASPAHARAIAASQRSSLGPMLPALLDVLPRLGLLHTSLPPQAPLPPADIERRFLSALTGLLGTFAAEAHPLALFIDDLQWADGASLDLMKHAMTVAPIPHLLLIGAYRDHDAPEAHPLRMTIADLRADGASVKDLRVGPLSEGDTTSLLADTLRRREEDTREEASILHQKTGGNPFFLQTILDTLASSGALVFDHEEGAFRWRMDQLRLFDPSDNVVHLLIERMQALPRRTRDLLATAACFGNLVDLRLLAEVAGVVPEEAERALLPAVSAGYLIAASGDYKFAHDRIQQAAYGLNAEGAHAAVHLRIGRAMRGEGEGELEGGELLSAVHHLNRARALLDDAGERLAVAALNLEAGKRAKASAANAAALECFEEGLALLGDSPFETSYPLALALSDGAAEAAYLKADFPAMDRHLERIARSAARPLDRVKAAQVRINALIARYQLAESIVVAREALAPLGVSLPADPSSSDIASARAAIEAEMKGRAPGALVSLPDMNESWPAAALHLLHSISPAAFLTAPRLLPLVAAEMVLLSLRHGLADDSVSGFTFHAMSLCAEERFDEGYAFGCLAEALVSERGFRTHTQDLAALGGCYVFHWRRPLRDAIPKMREAYRACLENGNIGAGANCLQGSAAAGFWAGLDLSAVDAEHEENGAALRRHKQGLYLTWLRQYHQATKNLRGLSADPTALRGEIYDAEEEMPIHQSAGDMAALYNISFNRAILCYHFHEHRAALDAAEAIEQWNQPGSVLMTIAVFYHGLSLLAVHDSAPPDERSALVEGARKLTSRMQRWGEACPANYEHKHHLMAAELARVEGRFAEARDHYDMAIDSAHEHGNLREEGLALERAALFFLGRGNNRLAGHAMRDAYYTYEVWGATAKLDFLRERYGHLLDQGARAPRETKGLRTATTSDLGDLDLATVLAATRAITSEANVDSLLATVTRVSLENAGAERGFLILARGDQLIVKVRGELGRGSLFTPLSAALHDQEGIAQSVVRYVARTGEPVILADAAKEGMFRDDPHIRERGVRSLVCLPIVMQGALVAVSYLENNLAASVFNDDRLAVLRLLMGQAAVSIENALLKGEAVDHGFRAGGSLPADATTYVRRAADALLEGYVKGRELCYVFNARQMGKSSLRVRAMAELGRAAAGREPVRCASIDLSLIGARGVTDEQWYAGVARALAAGVGPLGDFDLRSFWRDNGHLSPAQRIEVLLSDVILVRVRGHIAVFVDEIDAMLDLPWSDDFFTLVRALHNRRTDDERYKRVTFVLLGMTTPSDLIRDKRRTPFNVGQAVPLNGFRFDEAQTLVPALARAGDGAALLRAVLDWSGGQPFLTQKLCKLVVEAESRPVAGRERAWVKALVEQHVLDQWRTNDVPEHLKTIEANVRGAPHLLSSYQRILRAGEVDAGDSPHEMALLLTGLVTRAFDKLRVTNPIYAAVFNEGWVEDALAQSTPHEGR